MSEDEARQAAFDAAMTDGYDPGNAAHRTFALGWAAGRAFERDCGASARLAAAEARIAELTAALEWYASDEAYDRGPNLLPSMMPVQADRGARAARALAASDREESDD